jgi:hypothetical protein
VATAAALPGGLLLGRRLTSTAGFVTSAGATLLRPDGDGAVPVAAANVAVAPAVPHVVERATPPLIAVRHSAGKRSPNQRGAEDEREIASPSEKLEDSYRDELIRENPFDAPVTKGRTFKAAASKERGPRATAH